MATTFSALTGIFGFLGILWVAAYRRKRRKLVQKQRIGAIFIIAGSFSTALTFGCALAVLLGQSSYHSGPLVVLSALGFWTFVIPCGIGLAYYLDAFSSSEESAPKE